MKTNEAMPPSRRLLRAAAAGLALGRVPPAARAAGETACRGMHRRRC